MRFSECPGNVTIVITEASHYIVAGDYSWGWEVYQIMNHSVPSALCAEESSTQASIAAPNGAGIAVGCCSYDGSTGYRPDCDAYAKTYDEAKTICEGEGYRLCTVQEMLWGKLTANEPCTFDLAYSWVSDECDR